MRVDLFCFLDAAKFFWTTLAARPIASAGLPRPDLGCRWWSARLAATAAEDGLSFRRATCVGRPSDENGARDQGEVGFVFVMTLPGPSLGGRALDDPLRTKQKYPVLLEYAKASFERIKQRLRHL
jgi:hypothetical protein